MVVVNLDLDLLYGLRFLSTLALLDGAVSVVVVLGLVETSLLLKITNRISLSLSTPTKNQPITARDAYLPLSTARPISGRGYALSRSGGGSCRAGSGARGVESRLVLIQQ